MKITITGATGFVGVNLTAYLKDENDLQSMSKPYQLNKIFNLTGDAIIHLAGKAHDFKKTSNPEEYFQVNTELTKTVYSAFLQSNAKVFITLSSVKAVADEIHGELTEQHIPNPITNYGKSKLLAEQYILSQPIPEGKRVYILRPCMIHGPGNKGNLNLLYNLVSKGLPWSLGSFKNSRSYLSIENLCFIIKELIERDDIPSGIYNVADDLPISTNEIINMIAESKGKKANIFNISLNFIHVLARLGDFIKLPLNSERLKKLTESYVVSNSKIKSALGKQLPLSSINGLIRTFQSFAQNV